ncbi:Signal transduction histidine kinase [Actinopolymorpha cephalotaxi]|uniref:Signal transduction histidine kinase n=1 Tax=Actinopolymorpha cephalotaxi TaxID=504797 RepID=A0A1I2UBC9_9ACTN|nr:sensor histidine kinase [Actinopolymorpha cephalotaxi]NYH86519.1 signal transduction histidine kinase [Actinopolymorpha cephalotaxi]SFG74442.1 Signal transduction histidine kinase [Actinopolymorpha cephalotaxi]
MARFSVRSWEHLESPVYAVIPYVLLAVSMVPTTIQAGGSWPKVRVAAGLMVLTAGWVYAWITRRPTLVERAAYARIYFAGFLVLSAALVVQSPWFGIFVWVGYLHAGAFLRGRWRYAGIAATGLIAASSQVGGGLPKLEPYYLAALGVLLLVNVGIAGTVTFFAMANEREHEERRRTVAELAEANQRLQDALAENAGLHAQLLTQAREAGILDERQRMAREIHDTLAQGLTGIITQLEAAALAGPTGSARADVQAWRRHLDNATRLARESLSEARRSVRAIRPEALETARLPEALAEVAGRWSTLHRVAAEVTTTGTARPLHPEVEIALLRTAQEALTNVARHARATRVGLTLSYMEDVVSLDVRDDGIGFVPALVKGLVPAQVGGPAPERNPAPGHYGLTGMRQRVQRLAGRFEVESEPGAGTALSAVVPAIDAGGTP